MNTKGISKSQAEVACLFQGSPSHLTAYCHFRQLVAFAFSVSQRYSNASLSSTRVTTDFTLLLHQKNGPVVFSFSNLQLAADFFDVIEESSTLLRYRAALYPFSFRTKWRGVLRRSRNEITLVFALCIWSIRYFRTLARALQRQSKHGAHKAVGNVGSG